ncbi:uncharacterized protein Z520_00572 [Fonsecaea multimorphosa CBS 102226]|uniref:Yeast cell wall synthesis Kre9/Knh1-like N-terminal domain-containing protein n=1 Tax=Fonsecaea multimorphosa CBS 102226 TaxID=1442371 RepID=A0A0D2HPV2_9EURO|nr:uncharacterized protein Z520_00572 [Fonsecaea multimorphosa CBS 102226]KIY03881.1 hypothetical protein Z520_00572 [Fonsecaea multimorphosa CBS 102226]OAL32142.1 hypothetical protein AYO22_00591 [Fonsecaea multimorphosa]
MPSFAASLFAAGLATLAHAYTAPGAQTWGPLLTPDTTDAVTQGKEFTVTWDPEDHPTDGVTVSLVLCHGPSTNCVLSDTAIASGIPAAQKSFDWQVPCDLAPGTASTDTGYGMLIIVDGTGEFQYSTQFSVLENQSCSSSSSSSSSSGSGSSSPIVSISASATSSGSGSGTSIIIGPPAYQTGSSYTWGASGNSTRATTATGTSWASGASATATSVVTSYSSGYYSSLPGTTVIGSASTLTTEAAGSGTTTAAAQSSGAASAPAASASTFAGGAAPGQVGYSAAGLVIAGAVAVLAL